MARTALFINFTNEDFVCYWDGKPRTIKAGQSIYMEEGKARHFAKHLANRELIKKAKKGDTKCEKFTSPKNPEQVKPFWDLFCKAFILEQTQETEELSDDDLLAGSDSDSQSEMMRRNREMNPKPKKVAATSEIKTGPKNPQEKAKEAKKGDLAGFEGEPGEK